MFSWAAKAEVSVTKSSKARIAIANLRVEEPKICFGELKSLFGLRVQEMFHYQSMSLAQGAKPVKLHQNEPSTNHSQAGTEALAPEPAWL